MENAAMEPSAVLGACRPRQKKKAKATGKGEPAVSPGMGRESGAHMFGANSAGQLQDKFAPR